MFLYFYAACFHIRIKSWTLQLVTSHLICMHTYSFMCITYLNNSIESRDSVHFSSLGNQLALYFIPHCLDGMGVGADERHTLCCLVTNQAWQLPYRPYDTGIKERGEVSCCWMLVELVTMRLKKIMGWSLSSQFHSWAFHRVVTRGYTTHQSLCKLFVFREKPVTRMNLRRGRN